MTNDPYSEDVADQYRTPEIRPFIQQVRSEFDATPAVNQHGGISSRSQAPVIDDMAEQKMETDPFFGSPMSNPAGGGGGGDIETLAVYVYNGATLEVWNVVGKQQS